MNGEIKRVGVVGAGTMGAGIAQVALVGGYHVTLVDLNAQALDQGQSKVVGGLSKLVEREKLTMKQADQAKNQLTATVSLDALASVDLAIEAVVEKLEVKQSVFRDLDRIVKEEGILASNTSSISITKLGAATQRPQKVIGMHFMNPVPRMKLVEVIRGLATDQSTYDQVEQVTRRVGKVPVEVNDSPGFVSNRILMPMINEAAFCLFEGVGEPDAIDEVMKLGMNHPLGPLALADLIGLDVCVDILRVLHSEFGDSKYRPCPLLVKLVDAGRLGRKSGHGFYHYGIDR